MKLVANFFLIISYLSFNAQSLKEIENKLIHQLEFVHYEKDKKKALSINEDFKDLLEQSLKNKELFNYNFDSLSKFMSTVKSPDNYFRLFNWNIELDNQKQHYDCWIVFNDNTIIKLNDNERHIPNLEFTSLNNNNWFGALYFDIIPVKKKNKTIYTLLGWDGNDMFSNKKVIESMTINKKNKIQFGNSIFKYPDGKTKKRVIFQYNKKSYMSLKHKRIRKENYIVFDHLTPTSPHLKDFPDWYVTDLSFDAFKWDENKWIYINDFDAKSLKILRKPFNDPTKN